MTLNQKYNTELKKAMNWLATQEKTIFLGQAVCYAGTGCYESLTEVPANKKMEFPVAENFQIGVSTGLALNGFIPVSVVPRWNFLLSATDQIVNHLDKMKSMSNGQCTPNVIIRVAVGSENPINPQDQHKGDFSGAFRSMCSNIDIYNLYFIDQIVNTYKFAYNRTDGKSTIIVEYPDHAK